LVIGKIDFIFFHFPSRFQPLIPSIYAFTSPYHLTRNLLRLLTKLPIIIVYRLTMNWRTAAFLSIAIFVKAKREKRHGFAMLGASPLW
jgi:hypothetical protein